MANSKAKRGGKRAGAGRKPKAVTVLKQSLAEVQTDAARRAFELFDKTAHDGGIILETRLDCAREVMNRVWGKPTERHEHDFSTLSDEELLDRIAGHVGRGGAKGPHASR